MLSQSGQTDDGQERILICYIIFEEYNKIVDCLFTFRVPGQNLEDSSLLEKRRWETKLLTTCSQISIKYLSS